MDYKIIKADKKMLLYHLPEILDISLEAWTNGPHEQYLDKKKIEDYLVPVLDMSEVAYLAIKEDEAIGYTVAIALDKDPLLPDSIKKEFDTKKCLYIAEMDVNINYRQQGIGTKFMEELIKAAKKGPWETLFIRYWLGNKRVLKYYKRFSFKESKIIEEEKIKPDRSGTYMIKKQYLCQSVD